MSGLDDTLWLKSEELEQFGFAWGPMQVIRLAHPSGSGYYVRVLTPYGVVNVYVSERGRKVRAFQRDFTEAERRRIAAALGDDDA